MPARARMSAMATYIALLRGINVGGRRSLKMAALADLIVEAGGSAVRTYIQSGNAVFVHPSRSPAKLEQELEQRIEAASSMEVPVVLRTKAQWDEIVAGNPFPQAGPQQLHVVLLKQRLPQRAFAALDLKAFLPEEMVVGSQHLYLHLPNGMGRAKLPVALERKGPKQVVGTARNWATMLALQALAPQAVAKK